MEEMMEKNQALEDLVDHVSNCLEADATIVVDGNADSVVEMMLRNGYEWDGTVEYVGGKRIRMMRLIK
jgi:hypothetical protein